ncbi:MAG: hypothetical protein ABH854_05230 [Candidatus Diapherotrites archaeon]
MNRKGRSPGNFGKNTAPEVQNKKTKKDFYAKHIPKIKPEIPHGYKKIMGFLDKISGGKFKGALIEVGSGQGELISSLFFHPEINVIGIEKMPLTPERCYPMACSKTLNSSVEEIRAKFPHLKGAADAVVARLLFSSPNVVAEQHCEMLKGINFVLKVHKPLLIELESKKYIPSKKDISEAGFEVKGNQNSENLILLHLEKVRELG